MGKRQKRKLSARERAEKKRRNREFMTIFINGKQKRIRRPETIQGLSVDEFIRRNADPIWLHQNGEWALLHEHYENEFRSSFVETPLRFAVLDEPSARKITRWRYGGRYSIYDGSEDELGALLAPEHRYFGAWHGDSLVGYCCFGPDARVPGGNYRRGEPEVLDVGGGLRPDLAALSIRNMVDSILGGWDGPCGCILYRSNTRLIASIGGSPKRNRRSQHLPSSIPRSMFADMLGLRPWPIREGGETSTHAASTNAHDLPFSASELTSKSEVEKTIFAKQYRHLPR